MMKARRCGRCKELYSVKELTRWLNTSGSLSPEYCYDCYEYILAKYEDGMDVESMLDDDFN